LCGATVAALIGIGPKDEMEAMIAAQMLASHNGAMDCYRRAMGEEVSFEGRRENLTQANKLSRTYAMLLDALNRHRGKVQQKVTVEHVHVHSGGQAVVDTVGTLIANTFTCLTPYSVERIPKPPIIFTSVVAPLAAMRRTTGTHRYRLHLSSVSP